MKIKVKIRSRLVKMIAAGFFATPYEFSIPAPSMENVGIAGIRWDPGPGGREAMACRGLADLETASASETSAALTVRLWVSHSANLGNPVCPTNRSKMS